ncbi:hypothetical protein C8Q80DRAFT_803087 [Daedaleopsis nitida]|nr:hypothetical protein C8Q80DRAFT_803087 [Daedaleopsis nitida]
MVGALPTEPASLPFQPILRSIRNDAVRRIRYSYSSLPTTCHIWVWQPYQPIEAPYPLPYPLPRNFGFASRAAHRIDIIMHAMLNAQERTMGDFDHIVAAARFKITSVHTTRGSATDDEDLLNGGMDGPSTSAS